MAQLPPKVPGIVPVEWAPQSWVDEFLEFSSSKRRSHRRSVSDSVAFVEEHDGGGGHEFHALDDDQLISMFTEEEAGSTHPSTEKESTPSDNYSISEKAMERQEEAESDCQGDMSATTPESERIDDPKRVKRYIYTRTNFRNLPYVTWYFELTDFFLQFFKNLV